MIESDISALLPTIVAVMDDIDRLNAMQNDGREPVQLGRQWALFGRPRIQSGLKPDRVTSLHSERRETVLMN